MPAMTEPICAQTSPYVLEIEAGKKYAWCACGRSAMQPLCDGSHKGSGLNPVITTAEESQTAYFCGCKRTSHPPYCDGSHAALSADGRMVD